jgi:hypothetical protein
MPTFASAQNVDQLTADRVLLNAELERCKQLGVARLTTRGVQDGTIINPQPTKQKIPLKSDPMPHG